MTAPASDLDELIAEYLTAAEAGRPPDQADWLARHPDHAADLVAFLDDLRRFGPFLGLPAAGDSVTSEYVPREGGPGPSLPPPFAGERFGGYDLLGEIGRGGMGTVYRARLTGTSLVVALKQLRPDALDGAAARQFREEIEAACGLRHPNIVPVYHVGEQAGRPYFTMALVEGGSLDRHLDRFRDAPARAAELMIRTARAVHHAHQRRLLHRDLKPANILLDPAGEPHVADFGLAVRLDEAGTVADAGGMAGSLPWMAPEVLAGSRSLTTAVDVWALGVILYELLTGERPFRGTAEDVRRSILEHPPVPPRRINPRLPRDLEAVCLRCLEKDPDGRYESAVAVALELERWLRDEPTRARPGGRGERIARWGRRNPGLAVGGAVLIALVAAGGPATISLIRDQDEATRRLVCRDNEHAAELAAGAFLHRLDQYGDRVRAAADDPRLHRACARGALAEVERLLREATRESVSPGAGGVEVASMDVLDHTGTLRARWPHTAGVGTNFARRNYFTGAMARADRHDAGRVHVSRVFTSRNDKLDKLAVSVAFRFSPGTQPWVLMATVPTDPTMGLRVREDGRHTVVLLGPRDASPDRPEDRPSDPAPEYVILVHPGYHPREESVPFPRPLVVPAAEDGRPRLAPDDDYRDPVAGLHPEYSGRWLAGFAPVEGTELVVLVQQRYDDAVAPLRGFLRWVLAWSAGLGVAVVLSLVALGLRRRPAQPHSSTVSSPALPVAHPGR